MGQLSAEGKKVKELLLQLPREEQTTIIAQTVLDLGVEVAQVAPTAGAKKLPTLFQHSGRESLKS
jgi:hypothetical protein